MSRLRHKKAEGGHVKAGSLSGVHRLQVDKPHPFKPDEEKKHGGKIHGKHEHHRLGRKRGGHVKKKSDGGNVTEVSKTSGGPGEVRPNGEPRGGFLDRFNRANDQSPLKQTGSGPKAQDRLDRAKGGRVGQDGKPSEHGTGIPPEHGNKYITPVQDIEMPGAKSSQGGKFRYGHGHIEDSLNRADGGKVKWLQKAINPAHKGMEQRAAKKAGVSTHSYMEKHKHDSGSAGARARLGLRLSAMHKHKD